MFILALGVKKSSD